ncbi:ctr copper transporter domain-containing protein, putative [Eimeria praecox]|uniref:Ctr copper transporter domain-containing protein, putative n=1 Tax=Eimeria praecox TaxID=51316 RepID=U6H2F7_9EIME|nr:ctr copper transporter domain-containing protein, putative [Eimeria praecox]
MRLRMAEKERKPTLMLGSLPVYHNAIRASVAFLNYSWDYMLMLVAMTFNNFIPQPAKQMEAAEIRFPGIQAYAIPTRLYVESLDTSESDGAFILSRVPFSLFFSETSGALLFMGAGSLRSTKLKGG